MSKNKVPDHFAFGDNWLSFQAGVTSEHILQAKQCLAKLLTKEQILGRPFLDIGCGSGLSMLAALRIGASKAIGYDVDPVSVQAARTLLTRYAPEEDWQVEVEDIFHLNPKTHGLHEVVHSWGVLHHTGDVWSALERACNLVVPGGLIVVALYARTPFCRVWRAEKQFYSKTHPLVQAMIRIPFKAAFLTRLAATGQNPRRYIREYRGQRGMDWAHDVHDWLGGYPYESVDPTELHSFLANRGFKVLRSYEHKLVGLFGSACNEWVALRSQEVGQ